MAFIVFSGKFCWTMGKVDLALMNVYYISAHATLGFELTSFRILHDSSCLSFRFSHVFSNLFRVNAFNKRINKSSIGRNNLFLVPEIFQNWNQQFSTKLNELYVSRSSRIRYDPNFGEDLIEGFNQCPR